MSDSKILIHQRGLAKASLTRLETFLGRVHEVTEPGMIKVKYERLESIQMKYEESQVQLEMIADEDHSEDRIEFEERYDRVKSRF
ncbi:hypothetical protein ANN_09646 [Periplaneta americana]|uniref:Uncharacterized protein n=1 Tax=Periplaneta americana TaxID=6978 RepID=A0ABQ8TLV6_PERAM|nr:hypothetical protein ANN_09646 [Periplaneta americana]